MSEVNFNSVYNGYIYKVDTNYFTCRNAASGTIGDVFLVGQKLDVTEYTAYRGFIYFDTSGLPATAIITGATIAFPTMDDRSDTDFNITVRGADLASNPLVVGDYELTHYGGKDLGELTVYPPVTGEDYKNLTLNSLGLAYINRVGITKFVFLSKEDINNSPPTDDEYIYVNQVGSYVLTITYVIPTKPTVTTQAVNDISDVIATGNGNITATGYNTPTKRGICYNTTGSPTVADSKTEETGEFSTGAFTESLVDLLPGTLYYAKAYAMNAIGYSYGSEVSFTTEVLEYIAYGEWVKFITAAPGLPGAKPSGYKNDVCSDNSGYSYILNRSLTDDGASYESYFVLSTDLSGKKTLHTNKRLLDIFSYFINKGTGTAKVYVKRDTEPGWQYAGKISLAGEEEIIVKHLPSENQDTEGDVDFLAKTYLIKFVFENDFEFIGAIFEAVPIGDR